MRRDRARSSPSPPGVTVFARRRASLARRTRTLTVARCAKGKWVRSKQRVRVRAKRGARSARVRLPRLAAGGYRITGRGMRAVHLRIVAAPRARPASSRCSTARSIRAPMVAFCEGAERRRPAQARLDRAADRPAQARQRRRSRTRTSRSWFNAAWIPVRDAPGMRKAPFQYPKTCGEFRHHTVEGRAFLHSKQTFMLLSSTKAYDNLWKVWGLKSKPADFEQQVRDRYGLNVAPFKNPYTRADGSKGQLPLGLIQGQDAEDRQAQRPGHDQLRGVPRLDPRPRRRRQGAEVPRRSRQLRLRRVADRRRPLGRRRTRRVPRG